MLLAQACPALAFQEMLRRHRQAAVLQWRLPEENQKESKTFILICTRMKKDHSLLMDKSSTLDHSLSAEHSHTETQHKALRAAQQHRCSLHAMSISDISRARSCFALCCVAFLFVCLF